LSLGANYTWDKDDERPLGLLVWQGYSLGNEWIRSKVAQTLIKCWG